MYRYNEATLFFQADNPFIVRKLIVSMNITLDGYLSGLDGELDWHLAHWTREMGDRLCQELAKADTVVMGRITFEAMGSFWSSMLSDPSCNGEDFVFASMINNCRKIVFSKTLQSPDWIHSTVESGNLNKAIKILKNKPGKNIIVYGSSKLVQGLIKSGLVDEYHLWLHPIILSQGKSFFLPHQKTMMLKPYATHTFSSGVVALFYQKVNSRERNQ